MSRTRLATLVGLLLLVLLAGAVLTRPADARTQAAPVRLLADLTCASDGGANVTFTVRNLGHRTLTIENDFHLFLDKVGPGGRESAIAAFVFPAPGYEVIAPGAATTFVVPMGTPDEEGELGVDLSARRLLLEAEVFFVGRDKPARHLFSFEGCAAPVIGARHDA
jgi:hypothetical protein